MKKRICSLVLALILLLSLCPVAALAEETEEYTGAPVEAAALMEAEPASEPTPEPETEPTPEPTEPAEELEPTATPEPAVEAMPEATPEATPEPEPVDEAVAAVQALIDALPSADSVTAEDYDAVQDAYDAYDALTPEQQALITGAEAFEALFNRFNEQVATLAEDHKHNYTNGICTVDGCADPYEPAKPDSDGYYEIGNAGQLYWFAALVNGGSTSANAKLTDNITVNPGTFDADGNYTPGEDEVGGTKPREWTPIGSDSGSKQYGGTFDGNNKTISGLYVDDTSIEGLFGYINSSGTVQNVTVKQSYIKGQRCVGGIAGWVNGGCITGCTSSATVVGSRFVGGVVGESNGTVTNCTNEGTVKGSDMCIGGIVGYQIGGTVTGCENKGTVSGTGQSATKVGGVVGYVYTNYASPSITSCTNKGAVSGASNVGGVVGGCYVSSSSWSVSITSCTNEGAVSGTTNVGGVLGCNEAGSCKLDGCRYLSDTAAAGVGTVAEGSTVAGKPEASADDTQLTCTEKHTTGKCTVCNYQKVARVIDGEGETVEDYDSFAAALSAVAAGQTLKLLANVEAPTVTTGEGESVQTNSKLDLSGKTVTIDLNGKTLSGAGALTVIGSVTVTDGTTEGAGTLKAGEDNAVLLPVGSTLTVTGGKITSLTVTGGELTLNGTVEYHTTITPTIGTLTVNSGKVTAQKCGTTNHTSAIVGSLVVNGGTVQLLDGVFGSVAVPYGMDCLDLLPRGTSYYFVIQGDSSGIMTNGWSTVSAAFDQLSNEDSKYYKVMSDHNCEFTQTGGCGCGCGRELVIRRDSANYVSLDHALNQTYSNSFPLRLIKSITPMAVATADGGYENVIDASGKTVTIDLNNHKIEASQGDAATQKYDLRICGNVTITYGTVDNSTSGSVTVASGKKVIVDGNVTLANGTITGNVEVVSGGSLTVSGGTITGDVTVAEGGSLTVSGGHIGGNVTVPESTNIGSIFAKGYGFKDSTGKWYDSTYAETTLSNFTVQQLPIQGRVTIASQNTTYDLDTDPVPYAYGDSEEFTASVTLADGYSLEGATYEWKNDGGDLPTTGCTASGSELSVTFQQTGDYNFTCSVTVDGYTATTAYGGQCEVGKATLTEGTDYTAPTAETELTYNGEKWQLLIAAGTAPSGTQFLYSLDNTNWSTDYSGIKAKNAGTYTVYWQLNSSNYNQVTGTVNVTIAKKDISVNDTSAQGKTYDGTVDATVTVCGFDDLAIGEMLTVDEDFTVTNAKFADANAGNSKTVTATVTLLDSEKAKNYALGENNTVTVHAMANITPKSVTAVITVADKQYDGKTDASVTASVNASDLIEGDSITITGLTGSFSDADVGTAKNVTVDISNKSITGTNSGNYGVTIPTSATGNIVNNWSPQKGTEYTASEPNANGWLNDDLTVTAADGYELSLTNTATGAWTDTLTDSAESSDSEIEFYVRNKSTRAISKKATVGYKLDKNTDRTGVTGKVEFVSRMSWQEFLNTITFDLLYKNEVTVKATATDALSGVDKIEYAASDEALTLAQVKAIADWTPMPENGVGVTVADAKKFVYFIRVTDKAGNVTYFSTNGAEYDTAPPAIGGIENGATYYTTQSVTVTDRNLLSVKLNDQSQTVSNGAASITLAGNVDATYTITATDKAGNETEYTVTMKPISALTEDIDDLTEADVTSANREDIEAAKAAIEREMENTGATEAEKQELTASKDNAQKLLDRINAASDATATETIKAVENITAENVKTKDKSALEAAKTELEKALEDFGDNLTEAEKTAINEAIERIEAALKAIEQIERAAQMKKAARTGDSAMPVLYIAVIVIALGAIVALVVVRRKKK